jgi:hypothetical protein
MSEPDYSEVELAFKPKSGFSFYIESTSTDSIVTAAIILAAFLLMHGYAAFRSPPWFRTQSEFYDFNKTVRNSTIDIDISLGQLLDGHRFVSLNASLVRTNIESDSLHSLNVSYRSELLRGAVALRTENLSKATFQVDFQRGLTKSSQFPIVKFRFENITSIRLYITLESDLRDISGTDFTWRFLNPYADIFAHSIRMLLSFLMLYMLVLFICYLRFDSESFTHVYLLVIGIIGVVASNPLTFWLPDLPYAQISNHVLVSFSWRFTKCS